MKSLQINATFISLLFIGVSCSSDYNNSDYQTPVSNPVIDNFTAHLTAVSGTGSMASGDATLKLNQAAKTFDITVTFTGITPIHGHIHAADGTIIFPFSDTAVGTSPINQTFTITDAQITELLANHYYVNLHTVAFPLGEISGTLSKTGTTGGSSY